MTALDASYEQLSTGQRTRIRRDIIDQIRNHPGRDASFQERLDKAVRHQARKWGVQRSTIERVFTDGARCIDPGDFADLAHMERHGTSIADSEYAPAYETLKKRKKKKTKPTDRSLPVTLAPGTVVVEDMST